MELLSSAQKRRCASATKLNEVSSGSHLILTLTIVESNQNEFIGSKLNLVDLAGSERVKDSGALGAQLKEACHINKSLFSLT